MKDKLMGLWDNVLGEPALDSIRLALLEQFKVAFQDLSGKEAFETYCEMIALDGLSEAVFEDIIPDYEQKQRVTIRPTKKVEGPVTIMMGTGGRVTVPSVVEESLYFVIDDGEQTTNFFITQMAFFKRNDVFEILTVLGITEFVLNNQKPTEEVLTNAH